MAAKGYAEIDDMGKDVASTPRPMRTKNAGGRPRKTSEERRGATITILVTAHEKAMLEARAKEQDTTTSTLVRLALKKAQLI
jgi:hypothetical protein